MSITALSTYELDFFRSIVEGYLKRFSIFFDSSLTLNNPFQVSLVSLSWLEETFGP